MEHPNPNCKHNNKTLWRMAPDNGEIVYVDLCRDCGLTFKDSTRNQPFAPVNVKHSKAAPVQARH